MSNFYQKLKIYIKRLRTIRVLWVFVGLVALALVASGVDYAITQVKLSRIPQDLRIKSDKENIIGAQIIPNGKIYDKQNPTKVIYEGEVVKYAYKTEKIEDKPNEVIEKRTKHSRTIKIGEDKEKQIVTYQLEVISGVPQYYQDENGEWYQADYDTTDINTYALETKGNVIASLFKTEKVYATIGTFYPDADPETSTVDGHISYQGVDYLGTRNNTNGDNVQSASSFAYSLSNTNNGHPTVPYVVGRSFFLFDTSSLTVNATITSAYLGIFIHKIASTETNSGQATLHIVSSSPASNTDLILGDFDQVGSTSYSNITFTSMIYGFNNFILDSNGLANISKTSISKFGARLGGDLNANTPTGVNEVALYYAETNAGEDPKLVVTYTLPAPASIIWFE